MNPQQKERVQALLRRLVSAKTNGEDGQLYGELTQELQAYRDTGQLPVNWQTQGIPLVYVTGLPKIKRHNNNDVQHNKDPNHKNLTGMCVAGWQAQYFTADNNWIVRCLHCGTRRKEAGYLFLAGRLDDCIHLKDS